MEDNGNDCCTAQNKCKRNATLTHMTPSHVYSSTEMNLFFSVFKSDFDFTLKYDFCILVLLTVSKKIKKKSICSLAIDSTKDVYYPLWFPIEVQFFLEITKTYLHTITVLTFYLEVVLYQINSKKLRRISDKFSEQGHVKESNILVLKISNLTEQLVVHQPSYHAAWNGFSNLSTNNLSLVHKIHKCKAISGKTRKKDKANLGMLTLGIYYRTDTGCSNDFPLD